MADIVVLVLRPTGWVLLLAAAAWLVGYAGYRHALASRDDTIPEWLTYPILIGLCLLVGGVFVAGSLGVLHATALRIGVGVLGVAGGVQMARRLRVDRPGGQLPPNPLTLAAAAFVLIHLPTAFVPELAWDTVYYHLALPRTYLAHHSLLPIPYHLTANMPHNIELLHLLAFAGAEITAARLLSLGLDLSVLVLLQAIARRLEVPKLGGVLCVLYATAPAISRDFAANLTEASIGTFLLLAFAVLLRIRSEGHRSQLVIFGALLGWVMGCKYTAWFFVTPLFACAAAMIWLEREDSIRGRLASLSLVAGGAAAAIVPWLVRSLVLTGNPLYPNLHSLFDGRWWSPVLAMQLFRKFSFHRILGEGQNGSLEAAVRLPWDLVMNPTQMFTPGAFSVAAMILFVLVLPLAWRARGAWVYVCAAPWLGFALYSLSPVPNEGRYLVTLIPLITVAAAFPLHLATRKRWLHRALIAAVLAVCALQVDLPELDGSVFRTHGYEKRLRLNRGWWMTRLDRKLPEDAKILFLFENSVFFLDRDYWLDALYEAPTSMEILRSAGSAAAAAEALRREGITHLVINKFNAGRYLGQKFLLVTITDPVLLPQDAFDREAQMLQRLLEEESRFLFSLRRDGRVEVYELRPGAPPPADEAPPHEVP